MTSKPKNLIWEMTSFLRFQKWLFCLLQRFMKEFVSPGSLHIEIKITQLCIYLAIFKNTLHVNQGCPALGVAASRASRSRVGRACGFDLSGLALRHCILLPAWCRHRQSTSVARTRGQGSAIQAPDAVRGRLGMEGAAQGPRDPGGACEKMEGCHCSHVHRSAPFLCFYQKWAPGNTKSPATLPAFMVLPHTRTPTMAFSDLGVFSMKGGIWCHPRVSFSKNGGYVCCFFKGIVEEFMMSLMGGP